MKFILNTFLKLFAFRFVRFALVGFTSAVIDLGIYNLLAVVLDVNIYLSRTVSFAFAVVNGYTLNRIWTFKSKERKITRQFIRFFLVSLVGLLLNLAIMRFMQGAVAEIASEFWQKNIPVFIAIVIVYFWNFFVNKFWTFKDTVTSEQKGGISTG